MTGGTDDDTRNDDLRLTTDIGALLDGEMTEDQRFELEKRFFQDREARGLFRDMSRDNDLLKLAALHFGQFENNDRLTGIIDEEFSRRQRPSWKRFVEHPALRQTAAAALLVAATFGVTSFWMENRVENAILQVAAQMEAERDVLAIAVQDALETKLSGEVIRIRDDQAWSESFAPIKTYKSTSGHWCREYLRETSVGEYNLTIHGTACRDQEGRWTTILAKPSQKRLMEVAGI